MRATYARKASERGRWRHCAPIVGAMVAGALAASCGDSATAPPGLALPGRILLVGQASAAAPDGRSIHCFLDIVLDLEESGRTTAEASYVGTHGGHVGRSLLDDQGAGFAFDAFVGGEARATLRTSGHVDVIFPANENVDSRFWSGLYTLGGTFATTPQTAEGDWSCAPFDITEGYVDTAGIAPGRWRLDVP